MVIIAKKPIDYKQIKKSNVLVLNYDKPIRVTFLDNGSMDTADIIDERTNESKTVDKYVYEVIDLNERNIENNHKELSFLAKTFPLEIEQFLPIKDKSFVISKRQGLDKFDINFHIVPIE